MAGSMREGAGAPFPKAGSRGKLLLPNLAGTSWNPPWLFERLCQTQVYFAFFFFPSTMSPFNPEVEKQSQSYARRWCVVGEAPRMHLPAVISYILLQPTRAPT